MTEFYDNEQRKRETGSCTREDVCANIQRATPQRTSQDESAITHFQEKCFYFPVLVKSLVGYTTLTEELIKICMISHNKDTCTEKLQLTIKEYFQSFSPKTLKNVHVMKLQILSKNVHFQGTVLVLFRLLHSV